MTPVDPLLFVLPQFPTCTKEVRLPVQQPIESIGSCSGSTHRMCAEQSDAVPHFFALLFFLKCPISNTVHGDVAYLPLVINSCLTADVCVDGRGEGWMG